jgi:hypothetical protein
LRLRRRGISVQIIHHAGKTGEFCDHRPRQQGPDSALPSRHGRRMIPPSAWGNG